MNDRTEMLRIAAAQVGYKEGANNDNKFGCWFGMNNQPWCSMFVAWCAEQAGILGHDKKSGIIPRTAWVPDYQTYYQAKGRYRTKDTYIPSPGDIILYGTNSHVGIVESSDGKTVVTLEGNTSSGGNNANGDGVYRRTRALNNSWIKGYCVPEYKETTKVEIRDLAIKNLSTGESVTVKAGLQDNENYLRLRDVEKLCPIKIGYDAASRTPTVELIAGGTDNAYIISQLTALIEKLEQR